MVVLRGFFFLRVSTVPIKQIYLTIDKLLTDTTTPGQSEPGSNGNKGVLYIYLMSRTEESPSDVVKCYYTLEILSAV